MIRLLLQGKKWGDPGCDHTTIEDASIFYARLSSFWDDKLFPPTSTPSNSDVPRQILFVSHGGSIRALTLGLTTHRSARYTVALDADEAAIAEGINRRVTNCSITRIAVESVSNGVGASTTSSWAICPPTDCSDRPRMSLEGGDYSVRRRQPFRRQLTRAVTDWQRRYY
jgi:broad specificity phosphatase PhoE